MKKLINFFKDDEGATMPEYALDDRSIAAVVFVPLQLSGRSALQDLTM